MYFQYPPYGTSAGDLTTLDLSRYQWCNEDTITDSGYMRTRLLSVRLRVCARVHVCT